MVDEASRDLLELALKASLPVLVLLRRKKGSQLAMADMRSDGALEYGCDVFAIANPDHRTETANLNIAKSRFGPTGTKTVDWEALPRTYYRPTSSGAPE